MKLAIVFNVTRRANRGGESRIVKVVDSNTLAETLEDQSLGKEWAVVLEDGANIVGDVFIGTIHAGWCSQMVPAVDKVVCAPETRVVGRAFPAPPRLRR